MVQVIFKNKNKIIIKCPNCSEQVDIIRRHGHNCESFQGNCETCGWNMLLKDTEYDYVQPSNPLFDLIYKDNPIEKEKRKHQERIRQKENWKDDREIGLKLKVKEGKLKAWELKDIKKIAEDRGLE